jgi:hypothetical protein
VHGSSWYPHHTPPNRGCFFRARALCLPRCAFPAKEPNQEHTSPLLFVSPTPINCCDANSLETAAFAKPVNLGLRCRFVGSRDRTTHPSLLVSHREDPDMLEPITFYTRSERPSKSFKLCMVWSTMSLPGRKWPFNDISSHTQAVSVTNESTRRKNRKADQLHC